jgi:hypothetical protein
MRRDLWPFRIALFTLASLSIGSLLLYFFGVAKFALLSVTLSSIELAGLAVLFAWAWGQHSKSALRLLIGGLWAGCLATLAYDIVRIPIVHGGIPVFKAISYFGTVLLGQEKPSPFSELFGWAYHFSNGVSFALMYIALVPSPGPITAILEAIMLLTPYAEIFGYQRDARFLAITIGSHAVYGFVIWLAFRKYWSGQRLLNWRWSVVSCLTVLAGLSLMAADFNHRFSQKIPQSPPPYIGPHLYTVWDVPEPDRLVAIWVLKRYVDQEAVFHFIKPFEGVKVGVPFDVPEANVRRSGTQSATQVLIARHNVRDKKLDSLARMTGLAEVTPWMLASNPDDEQLVERLRKMAEMRCGKSMNGACLQSLLQDLDEWYKKDFR